jgi:hypothetical protein
LRRVASNHLSEALEVLLFVLSITRLSGCPRAYLESLESLKTARQSWHEGISDQGAHDKAFKQKMWPAQFFHFVELIKGVVNTLIHAALETTLFLYAIFSLLLLNQWFRAANITFPK